MEYIIYNTYANVVICICYNILVIPSQTPLKYQEKYNQNSSYLCNKALQN